MKRALFVLPALALAASPATASKKGWADASDIGAYSLMVLSVGIPAAKGDGRGALQAGLSFGAASLVTEGLKEAFPTTRPDGSDDRSFPSGHSSRSFAAAATLWNRQGQSIGIPAMVVAGFVATARVQADKHRWGEVAAGAAIGLASGFVLTKKRSQSQTALTPWAAPAGGGLSFSMRF